MVDLDNKPIYEALVIPNDALDKGGVEILRAGIVQDDLYVTARRAFDDPGMWGEVLGDITRRIARIYAAEGTYSEKDALAAISGAFAADLGAPVVSEKPKTRTPASNAAAKRKPARASKKTARRKAKR